MSGPQLFLGDPHWSAEKHDDNAGRALTRKTLYEMTLLKALPTLALSLLGALCEEALAQEGYYDKSWMEINQYSPVDNFQSRGSYGWDLGLGVVQTRAPAKVAGSQDHKEEIADRPQRIPRLTIRKGTPWPLDFSVTIARFPDRKAVGQYGGHIQWTLWEAFHLPTLALRVSRLETLGLEDLTRLRSDTLQVGSSYAPISYVTFSASLGLQWQSWEWREPSEDLALTAWDQQMPQKRYIMHTWGVRIQALSPFVTLGYEQVRWGVEHMTHHAQLSVLL